MMVRKAMIFAAGLGTRLRPLTDSCPKALVPVAGKPLLAHQLDRLAAAGIEQVVINIHHFAGQIKEYVARHDFGLRIVLSDESGCLLDTGGGLSKARRWLSGDEPVLVHNVDILSNVNLRDWMSRYPNGTTLLVSERPTQRYLLFDEENHLAGWTNLSTGETRGLSPSVAPSRFRRYAFSGIQLVSPELFPLMDAWPPRFSIIDFYLAVCHDVPILASPEPSLRLLDVGKPEALARAEAFLTACRGKEKRGIGEANLP